MAVVDDIGNGRVHEEPKIIEHENNDATGRGFCRGNPDDHRLRDLQRQVVLQARRQVRRQLLQRPGGVRQMLQG